MGMLRRRNIRKIKVQEPESDFSKSLSSFMGFLPVVGALLAVLSIVGSFAGMLIIQAYYKELGAPWYVSNLPVVKFIQSGAPVLLFFVASAYIVIEYVKDRLSESDRGELSSRNPKPEEVKKRLVGLIVATSVLGLLMLSLSLKWFDSQNEVLFFNAEEPSHKLLYAEIGAILLMISAGIACGTTILKLPGIVFPVWSVGAIYIHFLVTFWCATYCAGTAHARLDVSIESPLAKIKCIKEPGNWVIVTSNGETGLLMNLQEENAKRSFKLAKLTNDIRIEYSNNYDFWYVFY